MRQSKSVAGILSVCLNIKNAGIASCQAVILRAALEDELNDISFGVIPCYLPNAGPMGPSGADSNEGSPLAHKGKEATTPQQYIQ